MSFIIYTKNITNIVVFYKHNSNDGIIVIFIALVLMVLKEFYLDIYSCIELD